MNAWTVASITFFCTFGGSLLGTFIRSAVPENHMSRESQDVVRLGMGLVATMTALLLGLVTASAKGQFDAQDAAVRSSAVNILTLDRDLARYGPETRPIRDRLKSVVELRLQSTWPTGAGPRQIPQPRMTGAAEEIQGRILALEPGTEPQRWLRAQALGLSDEILKTRWRVLQADTAAVPTSFLVVVICWLMLTFTSFGLYAPRNATVLSALFIAALSVAAAVFLILELCSPFDGLIKVSGDPSGFLCLNWASKPPAASLAVPLAPDAGRRTRAPADAGCAIDQFCASIGALSEQQRAVCINADWKNDEPAEFRVFPRKVTCSTLALPVMRSRPPGP